MCVNGKENMQSRVDGAKLGYREAGIESWMDLENSIEAQF